MNEMNDGVNITLDARNAQRLQNIQKAIKSSNQDVSMKVALKAAEKVLTSLSKGERVTIENNWGRVRTLYLIYDD